MYFYGSNLEPLAGAILDPGTQDPVAGPFWTSWPPSEQTCQRSSRHCYVLYFKHQSQVVQKKKNLEYFTMYFYGSNLGPSGTGVIWETGSMI